MHPPRSLARAGLAALGAAAGAAGLVYAWPTAAGVTLSADERASVAVPAAGLAALCGAVLHRVTGRTIGAALLPVAALGASAWLPLTGHSRVHVHSGYALAGLGAAALFAWALRGRFHRPVTAALALCVAALGARAVPREPTRPPPPDRPPLVLLTLDTLRADHLAGFGGDVPAAHTPHLDAFFAGARVFRHAYAPIALTEPSHTTMLSGLEVDAHHVTVNGQQLPDGLPWAPSALQQAGWRTRAVVSSAVLDASLGLARGFDLYDSAFDHRLARSFRFLNLSGVRSMAGTAEQRSGADTLARVPDFPRGSFTWIHLYDAHWPYEPSAEAGAAVGLSDVTPLPATGIGRQINPSATRWPTEQIERGKLLYRASLQDLDAVVGTLLDRLPPDAAVVLSGDHGESLDEHDYVFAHGRLPYAPDVHTPLAVRAPGVAAGWEDAPVSLAQVAPTLLTLAGLPAEPGLTGPPPTVPVRTLAYAESFLGAQQPHALGPLAGVAIRTAGRTAAWTRWSDPAGYAPATDPRELQPLPVDEPEARALRDAAAGAGASGTPESDMLPALQSLGYVDGAP